MPTPLAPSAIARLEDVYRRYMRAVPGNGELSRTADELREACKALGWNSLGDGGYLPLARARLGLDINGNPKV